MDKQEIYVQHSVFTDPGDLSDVFSGLPTDVASLCEIVRNVAVHRDETFRRFGFELPEQRYKEGETRHIQDILKILGDLDERSIETRFAATCRDFSLLLCAMLRHVGVPARLRGGYARYLEPPLEGHWPFDDHWVVEYWVDELGWRLVDPQVWGDTQGAYRADFDVMDVPRDQFLVAGAAWLACRHGYCDPRMFGASGINESGMWVIQGTVVRDLAGLNHVEAFPWENWGIMTRSFSSLTESELALVDQVAEVGLNGGPVDQIVGLSSHPQLRASGLDGPSNPHRPKTARHVPLSANRFVVEGWNSTTVAEQEDLQDGPF
ncbi:transglutaminase-like domain-containing protein [Saccharopolyspora shandongensis]|uniref:transglutaminase-like domain-containing protein n=1 Tax=Saccharopolyspora shandongensis TaxID=418495 RepID=UPI0033D12A4F